MNHGVRPLLLACGLAVAAGCSGPAATSGRPEPGVTSGRAGATAAAAVATAPGVASAATGEKTQRLRGHAIMGKDGYGMTPCGESDQRIIDFTGGAQAMLDQFLAGGAREFFVDGWGGPAAGNHLQVDRIERLYSEGPGCQEALGGIAFIARGNEPFWSLTAGQDGLRMQRPEQATVSVPFVAPESTAAGFTFAARTGAGALAVKFTPGACSDGMSDTLYGWKVEATLGDQALVGCGFAGLPADRD